MNCILTINFFFSKKGKMEYLSYVLSAKNGGVDPLEQRKSLPSRPVRPGHGHG